MELQFDHVTFAVLPMVSVAMAVMFLGIGLSTNTKFGSVPFTQYAMPVVSDGTAKEPSTPCWIVSIWNVFEPSKSAGSPQSSVDIGMGGLRGFSAPGALAGRKFVQNRKANKITRTIPTLPSNIARSLVFAVSAEEFRSKIELLQEIISNSMRSAAYRRYSPINSIHTENRYVTICTFYRLDIVRKHKE